MVSGGQEHASQAESLFLAFLAAQEEGPSPDFDALCRERPELERELRAMLASWRWIEGWRDGAEDAGESGAESKPGSAESEADRPRLSVRRELARGGMGVVYEVRDEALRRSLAMKVCRIPVLAAADGGTPAPSPSPSRKSYYRFLEEAQITAQLDHPGVVPIHELGVGKDGYAYFTMRLVEGESLSEIFARVHEGDAEWTRTRALGVLVKVCETLAFAHHKGVLHRDLKPANIMVGRFGETYVMDWGLAKVTGAEARPVHGVEPRPTSDLELSEVESARREAIDDTPGSDLETLEGSVVGTPAYMPPEQAAGRLDDLSARSDVYSVGAILYHLLTGRMPYATSGSNDAVAILARAQLGPPEPLERAAPDVAPELAAISEKAMARRPEDRYGTMIALGADLRAYLENRVVRAHRTGPVVEARKWVARNHSLAVVAAGGVLGIVAALSVLSWVQWRRTVEVSEEKSRTQAKADEARFESYLANIKAAALFVRTHESAAARERLEACPPDLRDFEWRCLSAEVDDSTQVLSDHRDTVNALAFDATGRRLLSGADDETARLWDLSTGEVVLTLDGHGEDDVDGVDFSPSGNTVCTVAGETLRLWDTRDGTLITEAGHDGDLLSCRFSPDGRWILTTSSKRPPALFDVEEGAWSAEVRGLPRWSFSGAFDADGARFVAGARDVSVCVWQLGEPDPILRIALLPGAPPTRYPWPVEFTPDGRALVAGLPDGSIRFFDAVTGVPGAVWRGHGQRVSGLAIDAAKGRVFSASWDRSVRAFDLTTGAELSVLTGATDAVHCLALSPAGDVAAAGVGGGKIRLFDAVLEDARTPLERRAVVDRLTLSRDRRLALLGTADGAVEVWAAETGERLVELEGFRRPIRAVLWSADESRALAACAGDVTMWDVETGERLARITAHSEVIHDMAISAHGVVATAGRDEVLRLWDAGTLAPVRELAFDEDWIVELEFDPSGAGLVIGRRSGLLEWLDADELTARWSVAAHDGNVTGLAFTEGGATLASGGRDGRTVLSDARTGEHLRTFSGHVDGVGDPAFSPDGRRMATPSRDRTLRLWDVASGACILTFDGYNDWVDFAVFGPGAAWLLSGGDDRGLRLVHERPLSDRLPALKRVATQSVVNRAHRQLESGSVAAVEAGVREAGGDELTKEKVVLALELLQQGGDDMLRVQRLTRSIALDPARKPAEYRHAVELAEAACRADDTNAVLWNTLGIAYHRVQRPGDVLRALGRSSELNQATAAPFPAEWNGVFSALALFAQGREKAARDTLAEHLPPGEDSSGDLRRLLEEARVRLERR